MKVTALIPDPLVHDVRRLAGGKTLTDSLITALSRWTAQERIRRLNRQVAKHPLRFHEGFTAYKVRAANRH